MTIKPTAKTYVVVPITELELLQCADGELPPAEEREMFDRLDREPADWKRLALLLVESRNLSRGLKAWGGQQTAIADPPAAAVQPAPTALLPQWGTRWSAIAGLCLGLLVGIGLHPHMQPVASVRPNGASHAPPLSPPAQQPLDLRSLEASSLEASSLVWMQSPAGLSAAWRDHLERAGSQVRESTVLERRQLADGREVMLPRRQVEFTQPVSYEF